MDALTTFVSTCVSPMNLPYTILLAAVAGYWALVLIGMLDLDSLDLDFDLDLNADADVDVDADVDLEAGDGGLTGTAGVGIWILRFFGVGEMPLMGLLTFFILFLWGGGVLAHYHLGLSESALAWMAVFVPNVLVSAILTRIVTAPLRRVFRALSTKSNAAREQMLGKLCVITTSKATETFGQAEVKTSGSPIILNVHTQPGEELARGTEAVVVDEDKQTGTYTVKRFEA